MEKAFFDMQNRDTRMQDDRTIRLAQHPERSRKQTKPALGRANEDLGASFGPAKSFRPKEVFRSRETSDLDEDELRLTPASSQPNSELDLDVTPKPVKTRREMSYEGTAGGGFIHEGKFVKAHPLFPATKAKLPNFKKKRGTDALPSSSSTPTSTQPPTQSNVIERLLGTKDPSSSKSHYNKLLVDYSSDQYPSSSTTPLARYAPASRTLPDISTANPRKISVQSESRLSRVCQTGSQSVPGIAQLPLDVRDEDKNIQHIPKKPRPRPVTKTRADPHLSSYVDLENAHGPSQARPKVTIVSGGRTKVRPARSRPNVIFSSEEDDEPVIIKAKLGGKGNPLKQRFPLPISPPRASSPPASKCDGKNGKATSDDSTGRSGPQDVIAISSSHIADNPIARLSPLSRDRVTDVSSRTMKGKKTSPPPEMIKDSQLGDAKLANPRSKTVKDDQFGSKGKGKDDSKHFVAPLQAFPMELRALGTVGVVQGPQDERICLDTDALKLSSLEADTSADISTLFIKRHVDPKTLCPFCDDPLPSRPTAHLRSLLFSLNKTSQPDPRSSNPLGRRAPMRAYAPVCQRHRFECDWLPRATVNGWPTHINFSEVRLRVERQRSHLQEILEDVNENGARSGCLFWKEMMAEVRIRGTRGATSAGGMFATFERAQPGYYGEQGALIIHQTLFNLFPPHNIDPKLTHPLSSADFLQHILVPEAALALIHEDMDQTIEAAVETLRESAPYGVAMFPAAGAGGLDTSVKAGKEDEGDKLFRERATARRKEIEEEERMEEDLLRSERTTDRDVAGGGTEWQDSMFLSHTPVKREASASVSPRSTSPFDYPYKRRKTPVRVHDARLEPLKWETKDLKHAPDSVKPDAVKEQSRKSTVKQEKGVETRTASKAVKHKEDLNIKSTTNGTEDKVKDTTNAKYEKPQPRPITKQGKPLANLEHNEEKVSTSPRSIVDKEPQQRLHSRKARTSPTPRPIELHAPKRSQTMGACPAYHTTKPRIATEEVPIATDDDFDSDLGPQVVRAGTSRTTGKVHVDLEQIIPVANLQKARRNALGAAPILVHPGMSLPTERANPSRAARDTLSCDGDYDVPVYEDDNRSSDLEAINSRSRKNQGRQRGTDSWLLSDDSSQS